MKRWVTAALVLAFAALITPGGASAQASIFVGGGPTFPMSDYGDYANTGYVGFAGVNFAVSGGFGISAGGYFGSNSHDEAVDTEPGAKTNLYGVLAGAGYSFATGGSLMPSVFGLVGSMTHSYKTDAGTLDGSDTKIAFGGGAELGFPLGGLDGFVNGWYLTGSFDGETTAIMSVSAGVSFPLGGGM